MYDREDCIKTEEKLVEGEASEDENRFLHYILDLAKNGHFSDLINSHPKIVDDKNSSEQISTPNNGVQPDKELYVKVTRIPSSRLCKDKNGTLIGYLVQLERSFVWKCYSCLFRHKNKADLLYHYAYHVNNYACDKCNCTFRTSGYLQRHMKWRHSKKKALLKCAYCSLEYQYRARYNTHLLTHHQEQKQRSETYEMSLRAC